MDEFASAQHDDPAPYPFSSEQRHLSHSAEEFQEYQSSREPRKWPCFDTRRGKSILDELVVHPDSNFYLSFVSFMSFISLLSTFSYSYFIGFGSDSRMVVSLIILSEISYFCSLVIESLKAYDDEGDGTYEFRWQRTTVKYWATYNFKISLIIFIPFGLLGQIKNLEWMRIFWLLKIYRVVYFL